jgi:hypothetical protein
MKPQVCVLGANPICCHRGSGLKERFNDYQRCVSQECPSTPHNAPFALKTLRSAPRFAAFLATTCSMSHASTLGSGLTLSARIAELPCFQTSTRTVQTSLHCPALLPLALVISQITLWAVEEAEEVEKGPLRGLWWCQCHQPTPTTRACWKVPKARGSHTYPKV